MLFPDATSLLSLAYSTPRLYYIIPLIIAIGFVYGATRHERLDQILNHSFRSMMMTSFFLGIIFALVWFGSLWN